MNLKTNLILRNEIIMIYAIIILLALALAFIIVIRRLPQAINAAKADATDNPQPNPGANRPSNISSPNLPKINLPNIKLKIPKLKIPSVKLPKFSHFWRKSSNQSTHSSQEFWQDNQGQTIASAKIDQLNNHSKTATEPVSQPTKINNPEPLKSDSPKAPTSVSNTNTNPIINPMAGLKFKTRNLPQEAEDAFAIKDYKKAERLYLRLATEDPKNAKVYSRLGVIYLEQKSYEDARDALQAAIKLEPQAASRHFNLALCYLQLGSKAKAIAAMEQSLKHEPSNRKYRKMLDDLLAGRI